MAKLNADAKNIILSLQTVDRMSGPVNEAQRREINRKIRKLKKTVKRDRKQHKQAVEFFRKLSADTEKDNQEKHAEQHVTTETELHQDIYILQERYTGPDGLDVVSYCKALNSIRDNILFTVQELENAANDEKKSGNSDIAGYETMIRIYREHAETLATEIRAAGGTVTG